MVSERIVWQLIEKHAQYYTEKLGLTHCSITWHVHTSTDQGHKDKGFDSRGDACAQMIYDEKKKYGKKFEIVIYRDVQVNKKDVIGSIIHELLHVKMRSWGRFVSKKDGLRAHNVEEELVSTLEKLIVAHL